MDTTENKPEQYTKKPYPEFKPQTFAVFSEHITDLGIITMWQMEDGDTRWYKDRKSNEKLFPTWFMEPLSPPMEV